MTKKHLQPLTPAALYARVSSDRQDVDLSVSAQLRALKEYAKANGYSVTREYVDEAESGRVADRPQFREMIEEGSKPQAPFEVILVWKFSRFTRKREHAVAFKSQLRRKGIRVVSITEQAEDNATGRLLEGIIESVDEYYSENLAQEVVRGMREAASRGFFLGSKAPFGYRKIKVQDGVKERPSLEVDPATAPVVKEIFQKSLGGHGLKELCRELNERGVTNRGKRWYKGGLHYVLRNEAYTGAAVWGVKGKNEKAQDPVRVEGAWPALVSRELYDAVQQAMSERAPKVQRPGRVGSQYLLSGLLKCGVCGRPYSAQGAKSGQFAYYICGTLFREGAGTCSARYLNASRVEDFVVEKIRERILTEETIVELVQLVAEEIDAMAGELAGRLEVVEAELGDVRRRLGKLYEAIETSDLTLEVLSPRIMSLRHREEQLEAAREDAETQLERRRVELPSTEEIAEYVADFREFLKEGTIPERKALIRNFVEAIEVVGDEATLTYTVPMPRDGVRRESASVLDFVQSGPPVPSLGRLVVQLCELVSVVAGVLKDFDAERPTHKWYQPGIGPFGEPQLVKELSRRLSGHGLPAQTRLSPDLELGSLWAVEFKIVRPYGDDGRPAENWSQNLLHPYEGSTSLLGDALKLMDRSDYQHRCLFAICYEHDPPELDLEPLLSSFELIAESVMRITLSSRVEDRRPGLVHPVHQALRCVAWELPGHTSD